ncbi:hypothetical protein GCM10009765_26220 [Fodinicola feengrottensis]|uniref:HTH lysR-type domain-containing protein n=1 Tax=Fodinicola feengrottensis TaxID=435914 RepID=A0ABP4SV03_9ACTN
MPEPPAVLPFAPGADAVDLKHLRAFVAVADNLNFARAAERLYVSAPALSRQIRSLERVVGCQLFHRSTHRVELTLAGEALLDSARTVLAELDRGLKATRAVGGELDARMVTLLDPIVAAGRDAGDLCAVRAANERMHAQFPLSSDVEVLPVSAGGVPGLRLTPALPAGTTELLFLHGGGFVLGSAFGYRALVAALIAETGTTAVIPDYRLAPEHPFPAALDDAVSVYRWLLTSHKPDQLVVAADSAGACLALLLMIRLRDEGIPLPSAAVLLCPWLDLTMPSRMPSSARTAVPIRELVTGYVDSYLGGVPIDDPRVSPLHANLTGLPPMLVQAATGDTMLQDARMLTDRATECGVDVRLELYPVPTHTFHFFWSFLPEAATALRSAGAFVRSREKSPAERVG